MEAYVRKHPSFSLCGLNCCFCPRFHTDGPSRCPGCGGEDFFLKHPSCAVITCAKKHGKFEYCFECDSYPCGKYRSPNEKDSFISYKNVTRDLESASKDLDAYLRDLERRSGCLSLLLDKHNDGKSKSFFCNAANILPLSVLEAAVAGIEEGARKGDLSLKEKSKLAVEALRAAAEENGIDLSLRK